MMKAARWERRGATAAALRSLAYYALTGLILCLPALMNRMPLVFSDSGTYLESAHSLLPPIDRPIGYGFIVRALGWQSSLWPVVFFQGVVCSWLIRLTMRSLLPVQGADRRLHVAVLFALVLCSSLPWYASLLLPDVFAGVLVLCVFLLLFGRRLAAWTQGVLVLLLFFMALTHLTYPLILLGLVALSVALGWRRYDRRRLLQRSCAVALVPVLAMAFLVGYNARHGHGMVLSPTKDLFLAAKMIESGAMEIYLDRHCGEPGIFLCDHRAELVGNAGSFVWDMRTPTRSTAGMVADSERLAPVLDRMFADPYMWGVVALKSAWATVAQLVHVDIGEGLVAYGAEEAPWWPVSRRYAHELPHYMTSVQQYGVLDLSVLNRWNSVVQCVCVVVLVFLWPARRERRWWSFAVLIVGGLLLNAMFTGALANVYARLQARITWLLVFVVVLLLIRYLYRGMHARRARYAALLGRVAG